MSALLASLDKIREYLKTAPTEELRADWARVKAMKLDGPTYDELTSYVEEALANPLVESFTCEPYIQEDFVFVTEKGLLSHPEEFFFLDNSCNIATS